MIRAFSLSLDNCTDRLKWLPLQYDAVQKNSFGFAFVKIVDKAVRSAIDDANLLYNHVVRVTACLSCKSDDLIALGAERFLDR